MDVVILVLIKTNKEELKRLKRIMSYLTVVLNFKVLKMFLGLVYKNENIQRRKSI